MANPEALTFLEAFGDDLVHLTKRDASCYFDQLKLPVHLRTFFGRPPVFAGELARRANISLDTLRSYVDTGGNVTPDTLLYPVSCCWPMGYSWSSFVAQSVLLAACEAKRIHKNDHGGPAGL